MKTSLVRIVSFSLAALPLLGQTGGLTLTSNNYRLSTKTNGTGSVLVYDGSSFSMRNTPGFGDSWRTIAEANYFRICAAWQDTPVCIAAGPATNISQLILTPKSADWKQAWSMTATADGYYTIQNIGTGVALPDVWKLTSNTGIAAGPPISLPTTVYGDVTIQGATIAAAPPPITFDNGQAALAAAAFACSGGDMIKDFCLPPGTVTPSRSYIRRLEHLAAALTPSGDSIETRAALYSLVLQIAKKLPQQWTPDEQGMMNWLANEVRNTRLAVAQTTLSEYQRWSQDPWSYQPPPGYDFDAYLIPPANSSVWIYSKPKPPQLFYQSFDSYLSDVFFGSVLSSGMGPLVAGLPGSSPPIGFPAYASALVYGSIFGSDEGRYTQLKFILNMLQRPFFDLGSGIGPAVTTIMNDPDLLTQLVSAYTTAQSTRLPPPQASAVFERLTGGWRLNTFRSIFASDNVVAYQPFDYELRAAWAQKLGLSRTPDPSLKPILQMTDEELANARPADRAQIGMNRAILGRVLDSDSAALGAAASALTFALTIAVSEGTSVFTNAPYGDMIQSQIDSIKSGPLPDVRRLLTGEMLTNCTATGCTVLTDIIPAGVKLTPQQQETCGGPREVLYAFLRATTDLAEQNNPVSSQLWTQSGARDIGIDGDDNVWVIGQDPRGSQGNYGVWYYNQSARTWTSIPNYGVAISGMPYTGLPEALLVQADGKLVVQSPTATTDIWPSDNTQDVAMGQPYTAIWRTGSKQQGNDWKILEFPDGGSAWTESLPGTNAAALRIAVGPNNDPYVVNTSNQIYFFSQSLKKWTQLPGAANDIGGGLDGTVWIIGNTGTGDGNYRIYRWDPANKAWIVHPSGKGVRIAVDKEGNPWVVQANGSVVRYTKQ